MTLEKTLVYINGEFVRGDEARISIFDRGFQGGVCVFDVTSMWKGYLFWLDAHIDRFYKAMHTTRMLVKESKEQLKELTLEVLRRSGLRDAYVCHIASWGPHMMNVIEGKLGGPDWKPTLIIYARPYIYTFGGPEFMEKGVRVKISSIRQVPTQCVDPKIKTFNRMHSYMAYLEACDAGCEGVIMLDLEGYISEGRGENVFIVKDGGLSTPTEHALEGITRQAVFELARQQKMPISMDWLTPFDLYNADEAFFATSAGGITPIIEVDGRRIGDGKPGVVTERMKDAYWKMHVDPKYCTPVYD